MKLKKPPKNNISKPENEIGKYIKAQSHPYNADHMRIFIIDLIIMENSIKKRDTKVR
jgi:hypothetical protein